MKNTVSSKKSISFQGKVNELRTVDELASWKDRDLIGKIGSVINISRKTKKGCDNGGISLGFPRQRWSLLLGDLFIIILANLLSVWLRFGFFKGTNAFPFGNLALCLFIYPVTLYVFDLYNMQRLEYKWETFYRSVLAVVIGGLLSNIAFYLITEGQYGRWLILIQVGLTWSFLNIWRWAYGNLCQSNVRKIPAIILGAGNTGKILYELLNSPLSPYDVKGFLDDDPAKQGLKRSAAVIGRCEQLKMIANEIGAETAILAIPRNRSAKLIRNILDARFQGIDIREMADVYEELTGRIPVRHIADQWLLLADGFYLLNKEYIQKLKRIIDLLASSVLLLLTMPLIVLTALAIRIESPGQVFYKQERVGRNNIKFMIYKFRSMHHHAEANGAKWASEKDPRVTRVGRWLRLAHIDELPQILNIFKGDMSLVGPRPERPEFVSVLEKEIPYYFARHAVRPGVTGWAQVNYRYGASVDDGMTKLECDLYYIKNMSLFLDFKVLLRTIGVVLLGDGAR